MRTFKNENGRPLAVITGADHPTGLGAARAIHASGAEVIGLTDNLKSITCGSAIWKRIFDTSGRDLLEVLNSLSSQLEQPVFLLPTQDHLVSEISRNRAELPSVYKFVLPKDEIVQTFLNKIDFYTWAQPLGFHLPPTRFVRSDAELLEALEDLSYPVILKPFWRTSHWNKVSPVKKAFKLESAGDIDRIPFDPFSASPALLLSQWIEGPDHNVYYCLAYCSSQGEISKHYVGRKLLQYPRLTGSTAICVGVQNHEVLEIAREVFKQAKFEGLGSLEIKYDNFGVPYIIEPTVGRPNLQSYSAVAAGCNLQALAMDFALERNTVNSETLSGNCWWVVEAAIFDLITTPNRQPVPWVLLLKELLRARHVGGAFWDWKDPWVFGKFIVHKISKGAQRIVKCFKGFIQDHSRDRTDA